MFLILFISFLLKQFCPYKKKNNRQEKVMIHLFFCSFHFVSNVHIKVNKLLTTQPKISVETIESRILYFLSSTLKIVLFSNCSKMKTNIGKYRKYLKIGTVLQFNCPNIIYIQKVSFSLALFSSKIEIIPIIKICILFFETITYPFHF